MPDRNEEYYLEDIVFQVEDQLFKVHQRLFVKLSPVFRDMFKLRVTDGAEAEGLTDERPLVLKSVEKKDFVLLLRCLYPMQFPVDSNFSFTLEEWHSVLKLASLYDMAEVKTLVIRKMEPLLINLPSQQIHLARNYNIQQWLAPALYRLAQRVKPLDEEDVKLVGLPDSLQICALREKSRRCEKCGSCGTEIHSGGFGLKEIGHAFGIRGSNLPSSVLGCEQNCTCSSKAFQPPSIFGLESFNKKLRAAPDPAPKSSQPFPSSSAAAKLSVSSSTAIESSRSSSAPDPAPKSSQPSPSSNTAAKLSQSASSSTATESSRPPSAPDPVPNFFHPSPSSGTAAAGPSRSAASSSTVPKSSQSSSSPRTEPKSSSQPSSSSSTAPKSLFSFSLTSSPGTQFGFPSTPSPFFFGSASSPGIATNPVFSSLSTSSPRDASKPASSFSLTPFTSTAPNPSVTSTSSLGTAPNPSVTPTSSLGTAPNPSVTPTSSLGTAPNPSVTPISTPNTAPNPSVTPTSTPNSSAKLTSSPPTAPNPSVKPSP